MLSSGHVVTLLVAGHTVDSWGGVMMMMYGFLGFESMEQRPVPLRQYKNMLSHAGSMKSVFVLFRHSGKDDSGHSELPTTDMLPWHGDIEKEPFAVRVM